MSNKEELQTEIPRTIPAFLKFLFKQILKKKKYHLLAVWFLLVILGAVIIFTNSTVLLPAIYIGF